MYPPEIGYTLAPSRSLPREFLGLVLWQRGERARQSRTDLLCVERNSQPHIIPDHDWGSGSNAFSSA